MSFYIEEFNRTGATVYDLLDILEVVRDENLTGIGDFYQSALRSLLYRLPNFSSPLERLAVQDSGRIILRGLAAEKQTSAAPLIWSLIQNFDVVHDYNDGLLLNEGLITLGEIDARDYISHIVLRLENFNADQTNDQHARRKIQLGVVGAITALETLQAPEGIKPVFMASIGWYDPEIRAIASAALPHIMDDPATIISEIIQSPFNNAMVKLTAWQELLKTNAPNSSKAEVALVAIETSYAYASPVREEQNALRNMRISAIEAIRRMGAPDDSVYAYLERIYREAYNTPNTDFEVILSVVGALSALRTDESVELLTQFLREINTRRRSGPWGLMERDIMQLLIPAIAVTKTQSRSTMQLLSAIQRSSLYTDGEQIWADTALRALVK